MCLNHFGWFDLFPEPPRARGVSSAALGSSRTPAHLEQQREQGAFHLEEMPDSLSFKSTLVNHFLKLFFPFCSETCHFYILYPSFQGYLPIILILPALLLID